MTTPHLEIDVARPETAWVDPVWDRNDALAQRFPKLCDRRMAQVVETGRAQPGCSTQHKPADSPVVQGRDDTHPAVELHILVIRHHERRAGERDQVATGVERKV